MSYETVLSYFIGALAVLFCGWLFSLKIKGIFRIMLNTAAGAFLLVMLSVFTPLDIPLNPFNALLTGVLGLPALALIAAVTFFL